MTNLFLNEKELEIIQSSIESRCKKIKEELDVNLYHKTVVKLVEIDLILIEKLLSYVIFKRSNLKEKENGQLP